MELLLDQSGGLGTSQLVENARYQRAVEGELARSIMTVESVDRARVHLAIPRPSVFVRDRVKPTASVIVTLRPGRSLDDNQVAGIVHMVASSVPELDPGRVTVVDQRGRLLSQTSGGGVAADASRQLDYTRRLEDAYRQRVEDILAPVVGADAVRVQVAADVDFTETESTHETYDSDKPAIRSEQVSDQQSTEAPAGGVPGALTNQPPGGAVVASATPENGTTETDQSVPTSRSRSSTRNYELDRTIDHVRQSPVTLRRLSVAVVVDQRDVVDANGQHSRVPRDAAEMDRLTALVREAVGFDEQRGDSLNVVNESFKEIEEPPPAPPEPFWMQPWAKDLARYGAAGLGLLLLVFVVLRPTLRSLAQVPAQRGVAAALPDAAAPAMLAAQTMGGAAANTEQQLTRARQIAGDDPRLAAQVMRRWISDDGK